MDVETLRAMMPPPYEPRDIRLNKELENTLKIVKKYEDDDDNYEKVVSKACWECISCLLEAKMVAIVKNDPTSQNSHFERTIDGRNYFSDKRRRARERYGVVVVGALLGGAFTIAGVVLGYWLATLRT